MINTTGGRGGDCADFALRRENWKYIETCARANQPATRFLFDLATDIGETDNLVATHPEKATELERMLARVKACGTKHLRW